MVHRIRELDGHVRSRTNRLVDAPVIPLRRSICYVASYDPDYSRNVDVVRAFQAAGVRVEWPKPRSSDAQPRSSETGFIAAGLRVLAGAIPRSIDVALRLLRCRALVVGYFGQLDMLLLAPISRLLQRPVIFNPLVTLGDTIIEDRGLVAAGTPVASLIEYLDRWSLRLADIVIVDTPENREYIVRRANLSPGKVIVLPVGVDESIFFPGKSNGGNDSGALDVLFYGKFIPLHGVETILRAAGILESTHPGLRVELIGTGQQYGAARRLADDLALGNVDWTDWLPYSELGERLRAADVALGVFDGGGKAARVIPNKVHQALACGIPVVTGDSPAVRRMLAHRESAMLVPPDDPDALASAIGELADDVVLRHRIGKAGREAWERTASGERLTEIAGEILDRAGARR
ncbi:MAG: glycosyltransferase family 4 protein [Thermomicrobiales bacterium]